MSKQRITEARLNLIVERINQITNSPLTPYTEVGGHIKVMRSNPGNYHLDYAYGGVQLVRMGSSGGGSSDVLSCGHVSKGKLADLMYAFIRGLEAGKELK